MPFINAKITVPVPQEKRDVLKAEFGKAISIMNKPESYLMVGIEDNYTLYMGGKPLDKGAFVSVQVLGTVDKAASAKMSGKICDILQSLFDIPPSAVYITYQGIADWGWNGSNF